MTIRSNVHNGPLRAARSLFALPVGLDVKNRDSSTCEDMIRRYGERKSTRFRLSGRGYRIIAIFDPSILLSSTHVSATSRYPAMIN